MPGVLTAGEGLAGVCWGEVSAAIARVWRATEPVDLLFQQHTLAEQSQLLSDLENYTVLPKILFRQLDRLAVRRAVGGVVPGVAVAVQQFAGRHALGGDEALQRGEPVLVVRLARIGKLQKGEER